MVLAGGARAQVEVEDNYPAAMNRPALSAWLRDSSDLQPEQVVAVSPSAATAIVERTPPRDGRVQARLRAVAITPQAVARGGVLSWEMQLDVDCKGRMVRAGATTGYATRRRGGESGLALAPGDAAWRRPKAGTILEASWRAICDAKFQAPLSGAPLRVAETKTLSPLSQASVASPPPPNPALTPAAKPPVVLARDVAPAKVAPPASGPRLTPANVLLPAPAPPSHAKAKPANAPVPAPTSHAIPVRTATKAGPNAVQVVSSPIEADTRKKLDRLQHRFGPALQQGVEIRVVQAQVDGQKVYRGVVAGFATRKEARAFCQTLKQGGQDCVSW